MKSTKDAETLDQNGYHNIGIGNVDKNKDVNMLP